MSSVAQVAKAVAWNTVTGLGARVVGLVSTLVLARFMSPSDYGEVSTAVICVGTAVQLSNLQFGQYLIARGYKEDGVAFHAALLHVVLGWAAIFGVFLLRDPLGPFLGAPAMAQYMPGYALAGLFDVLGIVPEKSLARDMRFRLIALTKGFGELLYAALSLGFVSKYGAMAMVFGGLGRSALVMIVLLAAADRRWIRPVKLSWDIIVRMVKYSYPLAGANMMDFATSRWDNLLVSRFHGAGVMGAYNLAYNLSQTSTLGVAEHIADVLFPSFSRVEPRHRAQALVRAASAMALVVMPLAFGLASVSHTVVAALFPQKWALLGPMLAVLSLHAAVLPIGWTFRAFYKAEGRTPYVMLASVTRLAVLLSGLFIIGRLGPLWACAAVDIAFVGHLTFMWLGLRREHKSAMAPFLQAFMRAMVACVPMVAAVLGVQVLEAMLGPVPPRAALFIEIPVGAVTFLGGALLFNRPTLMELVGLVKGFLGRGRAPVAAN